MKFKVQSAIPFMAIDDLPKVQAEERKRAVEIAEDFRKDLYNAINELPTLLDHGIPMIQKYMALELLNKFNIVKSRIEKGESVT